MTAVIAEKKVSKSRYISWETFEKNYLTREDLYKYEWLNGVVEKRERTLKINTLYIWSNLNDTFYKTGVDGMLANCGEAFFGINHRCPDTAYYSHEQICRAAYNQYQVPQFIIEFISERENANQLFERLQDYLGADVKVIWHIFPNKKEVHVYQGKNMTICADNDLCSAEPVILGFVISVNDIFKAP